MRKEDHLSSSRCFQAMVPMRDGIRLNTFVFLPKNGGPRFPVILQRTPYGIALPESTSKMDCQNAWLPNPAQPLRGSILRGWHQIIENGYASVYQDTRGRHGSEGEDHVYADDAADGHDTLDWIAEQDWTNHRVGLSGSSAGATTALAAASQQHPSLRAFFVQVGASSIYNDVVYEGQSIELERLWLWVANNIPGLSGWHRENVAKAAGVSSAEMDRAATAAAKRYTRLEAAKADKPPFIDSIDWMRLPLSDYPDFTRWQPYLNEIITHPLPDDFRAQHNFRSTIEIPGFHVTTWFDIFQTSVIEAFNDIQSRIGNQRLWIGPNGHYFVYEKNFWPYDPYFKWFDHWVKNQDTGIMDSPTVFYSPRAWVKKPRNYVADDWHHADTWPPTAATPTRLYLGGDGSLTGGDPDGQLRTFIYDPRAPIPTIGGRNMLIDSGPRDQQELYEHANYGLIYRGQVLQRDLTIAGTVHVTLNIQSDCPDTDFIAKLIELEADGSAILLMDGVVRAMFRDAPKQPQKLKPGKIYPITINLAHIYHTFHAGKRIQIDITSSNFPRRARNTNSGNPVLANDGDADIRIATNTIHHAKNTPSFVELPILPQI